MKILFRLAFWLYAAIIIWLSLSSPNGIVKFSLDYSGFRLDYTLHVFGFVLMPIICFLASGKGENRYLWWINIGLSFLIAIGAEYMQMLVPGRRFNPLDILFNLLGLFIGLAFVLIYNRIVEKSSKMNSQNEYK
jgi:VanZ family protein